MRSRGGPHPARWGSPPSPNFGRGYYFERESLTFIHAKVTDKQAVVPSPRIGRGTGRGRDGAVSVEVTSRVRAAGAASRTAALRPERSEPAVSLCCSSRGR